MPGTPATTPNFAIPRYASTDPADFPVQYNAGVDRIDAAVFPTIITGASPPFPSGPVDGQLVDYITSGLVWRFRYTVAAPTYKWVCVGGGWMQQVITSATAPYVVPDTAVHDDPALKITVPFAGLYEMSATVDIRYTVAFLPEGFVGLQASGLSALEAGFIPPSKAANGISAAITIGPIALSSPASAFGLVGVAYKKGQSANTLVRGDGGSVVRVRPVAVN